MESARTSTASVTSSPELMGRCRDACAAAADCLCLSPQRLKELTQWLKSLPTHGAPKQEIGAQVLDQCVVKYIEKLLNTFWVRILPTCELTT